MDEKALSAPMNNTVVGRYNDLVIMTSKDYPGELFFCPMDKGTETIGEHLPDAVLYPICLMSASEQEAVKEKFGGAV